MHYSALILAGGKSSRMGTDKGLIPIRGKTMIERLLTTLKPLTSSVAISTLNDDYLKYKVDLIKDDYNSVGPLGGIHAGLKKTKKKFLLIVSVDTPFLSTYCVQRILKSAKTNKVVISQCADQTHPLVGVYPKHILSKLETYLNEGKRSVFGFLETVEVQKVKFDNQSLPCFKNINTPKDLY